MSIIDELQDRSATLDQQADELDAQGDALNARADELELKATAHQDFLNDTYNAVNALDVEPETAVLVERVVNVLALIQGEIDNWTQAIVPNTRDNAKQMKASAAGKRTESSDIKALLTSAGV